jgi:hypothetical protein
MLKARGIPEGIPSLRVYSRLGWTVLHIQAFGFVSASGFINDPGVRLQPAGHLDCDHKAASRTAQLFHGPTLSFDGLVRLSFIDSPAA